MAIDWKEINDALDKVRREYSGVIVINGVLDGENDTLDGLVNDISYSLYQLGEHVKAMLEAKQKPKTRLFRAVASNTYRAMNSDEAREMLQADIDSGLSFWLGDADDWQIEELMRGNDTEWLFRTFEDHDAISESHDEV